MSYNNLVLILSESFFKQTNTSPIEVLASSPRTVVISLENSQTNEPSVVKFGKLPFQLSVESDCLSQCFHENIVKMKSFFQINDLQAIQLEKVEGESLIEALQKRPFTEEESRKILKQLIEALSVVHKQGWCHRDLKPDNVIWNHVSGKLKLLDFELALNLTDLQKIKGLFTQRKTIQPAGTIYYMSPEVRKGTIKKMTPKLDVWSLGVTLFTIMTGFFPFELEDLEKGTEKLIFPRSLELSDNSKDLMRRMMEKKVKKRISLEEIKEHPWMKEQETQSIK